MLSVSANAHAEHLASANEYTGVFKQTSLSLSGPGSSVLLPTGRHVLSAAHSTGEHARIVHTGLPAPDDLIQTVSGAEIHPEYNGLGTFPDLAILELPFELDPALIERYDIYRDSDELNQIAVRVGFGAGGEDRRMGNLFGDKLIGVNRYGQNSLKTLTYDYL